MDAQTHERTLPALPLRDTMVGFRMTARKARALSAVAAAHGTTRSEWLRRLVDRALGADALPGGGAVSGRGGEDSAA